MSEVNGRILREHKRKMILYWLGHRHSSIYSEKTMLKVVMKKIVNTIVNITANLF